MKTTIEVADDLVQRVHRIQLRQHVTLRDLVEEGLRNELRRRETTAPFVFDPVVVTGKGLTSEAQRLGWRHILELANER